MSSIGTLKVKKSVLAARRMRFQDNLVVDTKGSSPKSGFLTSPSRIKGKCQDVDKGYLRLTEAADPALIRPLPVLKQALDKVKAKYLEEEDYVYACDQLKSIRQDLTVQGIKGRFTAHVYETHGRIALEQGDLNEYQACQVRLQEMAKSGTKIAYDEFTCYRLLYSLHVGSKLELQSTLSEIEKDKQEAATPSSRNPSANASTTFALEVIKAVRSANTSKFFSLYKEAVEHGQSVYILDFMLNGMREQATESIVKAYLCYPLSSYLSLLAFHDNEAALSFLKDHQVVVREGVEGEEGDQGGMVVDGGVTRARRVEAATSRSRMGKKKRKKEEERVGKARDSILDRVGNSAVKKAKTIDSKASSILDRLGGSSKKEKGNRKKTKL